MNGKTHVALGLAAAVALGYDPITVQDAVAHFAGDFYTLPFLQPEAELRGLAVDEARVCRRRG